MTGARVLLFAGVCVLTLWIPAVSQGSMRCQPKLATQCVNHLHSLVDYVKLYNSKHSLHTPYTSWGALCGASYETTLCITNSTKGCDSQAILHRFFNLIKPLDSLCTHATCNVTAGTMGFIELVEANVKRILNPYVFNSDFCWYRQTVIESAIQQSIPGCTPYFTSHLAEVIRIFQDPLASMCDTSRIKCEFGTPLKNGRFYKICDKDADCSADNYVCISQSLPRTAICCLKYETSESCDMTAIHNCFTKFAVKAVVELTSVIPSHFEICSELNKTRSCVAEANVNCTSRVRTSLTDLADTLQKHLDKAICVDTCSGSPCRNGGTCTARFGWYTCVCSRNFTGSNCETNDTITSTTPSATSTSITNSITNTVPYSTTAYITSSRQVILVVRLAMPWKDSYENKANEETQVLITALEKALGDIYKSISGFQHVQVQRLFQSSIGVEHVAVFDNDLSDADCIAIGLVLTSALQAGNSTLTLGSKKVDVSGKTEMLIAGEKVEMNDACFLYNKKHLCQNGGTCVASQTSASCVCASGYVGAYCGATNRKTNNKTGIALGVVIAVILIVALVIGSLLLYRRRKQRPCHTTTPTHDDNKNTRRSETDMTSIHFEMTNIKDDATNADVVSSPKVVVSETPNPNN